MNDPGALDRGFVYGSLPKVVAECSHKRASWSAESQDEEPRSVCPDCGADLVAIACTHCDGTGNVAVEHNALEAFRLLIGTPSAEERRAKRNPETSSPLSTEPAK